MRKWHQRANRSACRPRYPPVLFLQVTGFWNADSEWLRSGQLINLGQLPSPSNASEALFINQRGQIVGDSNTTGGAVQAVLWQHQKLISLGTPLGEDPVGLNDRGQVLVSPDLLWQDGKVTDLTTLGVVAASLHGINDRGELAGTISLADDTSLHAALWR